MRFLKVSILAFFSVVLFPLSSFAAISNVPPTVEVAIASADIVAVVKVKEGGLPTTFLLGGQKKSDSQITFTCNKDIKGSCPKEISLAPGKDLEIYAYGGIPFSIKEGDNFVILLKQKTSGLELLPNCPSLIPVTRESASEVDSTLSVSGNVESILSKGCAVDSYRLISVFLLSQFDSEFAMRTLAHYVDDKNDIVADAALSCFARNQQVSAIPRIVSRSQRFAFGGHSVPLLSRYKVKEAKNYLERAMFSFPSGVRLNSVLSLSMLADKDSVPFLLLPLFDEDPQGFIGPYSCSVLHKLIPELPNNFVFSDYKEERKHESQIFLSWWRNQLDNDSPTISDKKENIVLTEGKTYSTQDVQELNEALFMHSKITRHLAIESLSTLANESSIPYLITALYDPKFEVSYGSHKILARLVPALGPTLSEDSFKTSKDVVASKCTFWWTKHLQDKEAMRYQEYVNQMEEKIKRQLLPK